MRSRSAFAPQQRTSGAGVRRRLRVPSNFTVTAPLIFPPDAPVTPLPLLAFDTSFALREFLQDGTEGRGGDLTPRGGDDERAWSFAETIMRVATFGRPHYPDALRSAGMSGRVMARSSLSSSLSAWTIIGSSAIPHFGQVPGESRTISGCIGQVYLAAE